MSPKLIVVFTHFDEVKGDNLVGIEARTEHVCGSFFNAVKAIGRDSGRDAEHSLKRLHPDRIVFLANIHSSLPEKSRFTRNELCRLLTAIQSSIQPTPSIECHPVYAEANLVPAMRKATQEFHARWRAVLGLSPQHHRRGRTLAASQGFGRGESLISTRMSTRTFAR